MKTIKKFTYSLLIALTVLSLQEVTGQSVLDPSDSVITYDPLNPPPPQPAFGSPDYYKIRKWIRTKRLNWNTDSYKAYIYKGAAFRLKFPKTYVPGVSDGKTYPLVIMMHGLGERDSIKDNEYHLYHGGQKHRDFVDNGQFDGYVLFMQTVEFWGPGYYNFLSEIIDYMVANNKLDQFRVSMHGLSAGAAGVWEMITSHPTYIASAAPMSTRGGYNATLLYTPIWSFNGGLDPSPTPADCAQVAAAYSAAGANFKTTFYPNLGHDTWTTAYNDPDFVPFLLRAYMSNPWPVNGRKEFCPGEAIDVTIGVRAGFDQYQWRKNGIVLPRINRNTITIKNIGVYDCRVRKGSTWSQWSPLPVEIKTKVPTVSPTIGVSGLMSKVIPALDGHTAVTLAVPTGYATYAWKKTEDTTILGTQNTLSVSVPGAYQVRVVEQFGCSSDFSSQFNVIDADGPNKPDAAQQLIVSTVSNSSLRLDWSENPTPNYNETGFEIYQSLQPGGPYKLIAITGADITTYLVNGLGSNVKYYYKLRAVNNTGASAASNEASGTTSTDVLLPGSPGNLRITATTGNTISLAWDASIDDVGIRDYNLYINGALAYVIDSNKTSFVATGLQNGVSYVFTAKAVDLSGNLSSASNQVTGQALISGLNYKHYTGSYDLLPDFTLLTPVVTGTMPNVAITPRVQNDNFAFLWEGYITIPTTGTYYFRTNSDDGSKLFLGNLNGTTSPYTFSGPATVNNDGLHGQQDANSAALALTAGVYPIAICFFEKGSGEAMSISWRTPSSPTSYVAIPNAVFVEAPANLGTAPSAPSFLKAAAVAYNKINLTWKDNSSNETGFEIYRSKTQSGGYSVVAVATPDATTYADSALEASTTYYYQIRAVGQFGESALVSNIGNGIEAKWGLNNALTDASGNGRLLTAPAPPSVFDAADKVEGSHAVTLNGTTQNLNIPASPSFLQNTYTQKTITFWAKSGNNTGNRFLVEIGGGDNGLAIKLDASKLLAGVASGSVLRSIETPFTSTAWNHIALVYDANSLKLFVNGALTVTTDTLPFTSIGATGGTSKLGFGDGGASGNVFLNATPLRFNGKMDDVGIYNRALTAAEILDLSTSVPLLQSFATTLALPAAPATPAGLVATGVSPSSVNISWSDVNNETGFELYKSNNNNANYILFATLPANTVNFENQDLFANATYYYKVRAIGQGGGSAYSNEDSAKTKNTAPVFDSIRNRTVRYGITTQITISATDSDGDALAFTTVNLPAFASIVNNGNKTATLNLSPSAAQQAVYNNISYIVSDGNGGSDTTTFVLTVNDNFDPAIDSVGNYTVDENASVNIPLSGVDQNPSDVLRWSVVNLPAAFTIIPSNGRSAALAFNPRYGTAGTYTVTVNVTDSVGGFASRNFAVTVNAKDPNTQINLRIQHTEAAPAPWNNITSAATAGLKDIYGQTTTIGINFPANVYHTIPWGPVTGNNSGVYPDVILKDNLYFGEPWEVQPLVAVLSGLTPSREYNLTFYAGINRSEYNENHASNFTVNGQTVSVKFKNNTTNTATIENLSPAADGTLNISMIKSPGAALGFLNSIVIYSVYEDGTVPAAPASLVAQNIPSGGVNITWQDLSYNEKEFEVYRSTSENGTYTKISNRIKNNVNSYIDSAASALTTYYYKVRATNDFGPSAYSNIFSVVAGNRIPALNAITNINIRNDQTASVNIVTVDDASDNITLSVENLPSFSTFTDNGDGTGVINVVPQLGNTGRYSNIRVTATDNSNATVTSSFEINITDKDVTSMYVTFSDGGYVGTAPWNNLASWPGAGVNISNIKDESGVATGVSVTLVDGFDGVSNFGARPGNGTNIYQEQATRGAFVVSSANTKTIRVAGLSTAKVYNFVFFNSTDFGTNGNTVFTINGTNVTLNAAYNTNKTVQINGIAPNASGQVDISVKKDLGADIGVINTLIIQGYSPAIDLLSPSNLRISHIQKNKLSLQWEDRSFGETGFEIWRATSPAGSYTLLNTVGVNVASYTDQNLNPNKVYYYIVRAKKGTTYSAYTSVASAATYANTLYVNFTSNDIAPLPWNNTRATPDEGYVFNNFKFDDNGVSSIEMAITRSFSEIQPLGMNTGNNSGFFPDNVIKKTYCVFPGATGEFKLKGLSLGFKYDITLFGSQNQIVSLDATSVYVINGKRYIHNSARNLGSGNVIAYGILPDQNGEIFVSVTRESSNSLGGYLCGIIVSGYANSAGQLPTLPPGARVAFNDTTVETTISRRDEENAAIDKIIAYPNPFKEDVTMALNAKREDKVMVNVYTVNGQLVYSKQFTNLNEGINYVKIQLGNAAYSNIYFAHIDYINRKLKNKVIKLMRSR